MSEAATDIVAANDGAGPKRKRKPKPPPLPRRDWWRRFGLMTLAGVLTFLSFPLTTERDSNFWPLAWVALVPFLEALRGLRGKQGFWFGAWCGLVTNFGGFWWISEVLRDFGHLPFYVYWPLTLLNSFYQGLMFAVVGLLVARASRRLAVASPAGLGLVPVWQVAAIYTLVEWLYPMIFPWYLANGQYRFLPAIQLAELGGVMSVTFVMVAFNAGLHRLWVHRALRADPARPPLPRRALVMTFLGTAAVLVYGQVRVMMVDADIAAAKKVKLGLVEADVGIFEKQAKHLPPRERALTLHRNLLKHQTMSAELAAAGVDLVVWPESSFFPLDDPFIKRTDRIALGLGPAGLAENVYDAARDVFVWRPLGPRPGAVALAALREDRFATLGPDGIRDETGAVSTLPPGRYLGLTLVEAPGFSRHEDGAKAYAWAVGEGGAIASGRLGEALTSLASGTTQTLRAVAMRTAKDGVVVGDGGTVLEIERDKVRAIPLEGGGTVALRAVAWGEVPGIGQLAIAVGGAGTVAVRLEDGWQVERVGDEVGLAAVAFDRRGQPWIAGSGGYVAARTGGAWRTVALPTKADAVGLAVDPLGAVLVSDADGRVWSRAEGASSWVAADPGTPTLGPLVPAPWTQAMPLPRDVRWVRQGIAPLPALEAFDRDPAIELAEIPVQDRTAIQRGFSTPVLLGGLTWAPPLPGKDRRQLFNTAILLDKRGRVLGTYDKVYLLAFGEYMPFGDTFPGLYDAFPTAGHFSAGNEVRTFPWGDERLGIMICYEDIMADFTGKLADLHPNAIINVTNDAWFGKTSEPWLHLALAVFRAVENRVELVRATNTGVSAFIDPTGRLTAATRLEGAETLIGEVPMMHGATVYGAVGNLFAWLLLAAVVAERARAWWTARARR